VGEGDANPASSKKVDFLLALASYWKNNNNSAWSIRTMSPPAFAHLFEPLVLRGKRLKKRIMSSGHDTSMPTDNRVNAQLIAYHRARAEGGVGLIVLQVAGVHASARYTSHVLMATDDACIDGYRELADICHAQGTVVLSQIFHPGREIMESADGLLAHFSR
jgi:2,4-dienoyl-CoA reductase-like NADH-dependent reductase (Old Yellow Enzyme family)